MIFNRYIAVFLLFAAIFCTTCTKVEVSPVSNPSASAIKVYGNQFGNFLGTFEATADGGYVFGGYTIGSAALQQQGFIQKCDGNGNLEWYQTYGGSKQDLFWVVHPTSDGGYIAAGATTSYGLGTSTNNQSAYLVKTDAHGLLLWQKAYGGANGALFYDVTETPDQGFVAVGSQAGKFYVVKTDQNGNSLWSHGWNVNDPSFGASVVIGPDSEIAVAGIFLQYINLYNYHPTFSYLTENGDFIVLDNSVDHNHNVLGYSFNSSAINNSLSVPPSINVTSPLSCEKIIRRPDGFIWVYNCIGFTNIELFKTDFAGNLQWYKSYKGNGGTVYFSDASNSPNGGLLISGGTTSPNLSDPYYCWLLNTDSSGNKLMESFIPMPENAWAAGAVFSGNSIAIGTNLTTPSNIHANYFGFLLTDQNGNIKK